jgi:TnpA family transposase
MTDNINKTEVNHMCEDCGEHQAALEWMGRYYDSEIRSHKLMAALEECTEIARQIRNESAHRESFAKSEIARSNANAAEIAARKIYRAIEQVAQRARNEKGDIF